MCFHCCRPKQDGELFTSFVTEYGGIAQDHARQARDLRITAFALSMISIFLLGLSYSLYGLGTLPPTVLFGLNMFPYLGGVFFSLVTLGLAVSAIVVLVKSAYHSHQKAKLNNLLN